MKLTREERKAITAAVDNDPELAATRDHFLERFEVENGRGIGPASAGVMLYVLGSWLARQDGAEIVRVYRNGRSTADL